MPILNPQISIILPVFNEALHLQESIEALVSVCSSQHQLIIVDGGSEDATLEIADSALRHAEPTLEFLLIQAEKGRAVQMNAGAARATGDVLLFLHADTHLPADAIQVLQNLYAKQAQGSPFWGRFDVRLSGHNKAFRVIETFINLRSRLTSVATGDQAIFIDSKLFQKTGGYPDIALMEDIAISKRLRNIVAPVCLKARVLTSSRRWESRGILSTVLLMWKLRFLYLLGVSPARLVKMYR